MEVKEFFNLVRRRKQTVISILLVCLAVTVLLVAVQSFKYGSTSRLLVSQEFTAGTDAYTISQSNNFLSKLFSRVVQSESFYNDVLSSGYNIDESYFTEEGSRKEKMKQWNKTVRASSPNTGNGIVEIEVYHPDRDQVEQIAQAVNYVLKTQNKDYHGLGNKIFLKIIDKPLVSEKPEKPDVLMIFPASVLLALFLAGVYIYFFPEDRYDIKIIPENGFKKKKTTVDEQRVQENKRRMLQGLSSKFSPRREKKGDKETTSINKGPEKSEQESRPKEEEKSEEQEVVDREEKAKERVLFGAQAEEDSSRQQDESVEEGSSSAEQTGEQKQESANKNENKKDIEEKGDMSNIFG
jgi:capsular polysaccharide biosynthesis protein